MPATLIIQRPEPPPELGDGGGVWRRGEIVNVIDASTELVGARLDRQKFYLFTVTDKTVAEVEYFMARWNKAIDMNVIAGPDPAGFRRINVRNNLVSVSGIGAWTTEQADSIIQEWNTLYPECNLTTVDFPSPDVWTCEGTFTTGQALEFNDTVVSVGLNTLTRRTQWYITPAGMDFLESQVPSGEGSGTAQQLGGIIRDGLLD